MSRPTLVVAARVMCYVNGKLYGQVTGFSWNSGTPRKKIRCIDIPYPVELAPTTTDVTWNMQVLRTIGDGGAQGAGIVAGLDEISREKYFTILLVERGSDLPLFKADFCSTDAESWSINAKGLMQGTINGGGILWNNEAALK